MFYSRCERFILASHDVRRAFDSGIHSQLLLSALKRGVDQSVILAFRNMYKNLQVQINILSNEGLVLSSQIVQVKKGIRQGAISSPLLYNNSIIEAQKYVKPSFIFRGVDITLLNYADDILNISRSLTRIEENFDILNEMYGGIGLSFNSSKSEFIVFNGDSSGAVCKFGNQQVIGSSSIMYLGLPISSDMISTRAGLLRNF